MVAELSGEGGYAKSCTKNSYSVKYVLVLLQMSRVLQGHTNFAQPNIKVDVAEWKKMYDEALGSSEVVRADCGSIIFKGKE